MKGLANPSCIYFQPPNEDRATMSKSSNPRAIITPKVEKCGWGHNCPICKNIENEEEDWNSNRNMQNIPCSQSTQQPLWQNLQAQTQNVQSPQNNPKAFDIPDRYSEKIKLQREWGEKMERLNKNITLTWFPSSELDSESDEEDDYRYEHKYKTLIWTIKNTKRLKFVV